MKQWLVATTESGQSLLHFLKSKLPPSFSNRAIKQLLEQNSCMLNGQVERFASVYVATGDKIALALPDESSSAAPISILYVDEDFLFIDKPVGYASDDLELLKSSQKASHTTHLTLLHRLDKGTSGVLAFAKHEKAALAFEDLFRTRHIKKRYVAIVYGIVKLQAGHIDNFLTRLKTLPGQSLWGAADRGLRAITDWRVLKRGKQCTLLECFPHTGRTHQIRVHMSGMGFPILGDVQYGQRRPIYTAKRPLLHAAELSFLHPFKQEQIVVQAALPKDFLSAMQALGLV